MTVRELIYATTQRLEGVGIPSARLDAEILLAFCLDCDRLEFIKRPERKLSNEQLAAFKQLVARRANCEPVAYITGRKAFWSFTLEVNPDVLIPRPDTEVIVEEARYPSKKGFGSAAYSGCGHGQRRDRAGIGLRNPRGENHGHGYLRKYACRGSKKRPRFGAGSLHYFPSG